MAPFDPPFSGYIQPPGIPPDPTGNCWRGPPGPVSTVPGPQGPVGLVDSLIPETANDLQPARHLSNLIGKTTAVVCIIGDSTSTDGPVQVGTAGGALTANGVDQSQMLWAMLCDKLRTDNPQITSWTFLNFGIGGSAENGPLLTGTALGVNQTAYPWFTDLSQTWLSYVQAAQPDVLFYLFGTNSSAAGAPPPGGGGGGGASIFISDNLAAIDAWAYTPNVVMVTNKTSTPADTTPGPDDLNSSNHLGQASFHRTFARSTAAGYTAFPKCLAKGFGLVDLGRYAAARLYGYDPAAQYMRAVASAIRTGIPLVHVQSNVSGPGTVGKSTHGDFRLTFVLRGGGGAALNAMGISIIVGISNFLANYIRLQIGAPYGTGYIWPMYIIDGAIFGAPAQFGSAIPTTNGQDVVITVSASGPHIRVWVNGTLALNVLAPRFVTPTFGGCPINVVANVDPNGSPLFDVTEFYEGVGSPAPMAMDYAATFGTHASGSGAVDGYQGGNAINHQTSMSAAYDRRVINAMNFCVPATGTDVSNSPVTATGSTTPRMLNDRFADWVNAKDFGAPLDGVGFDNAAYNAARGAVGTDGSVYVPYGHQRLNVAPTSGPTTQVLWRMDGTYIGTAGANPVLGIGTDVVENFFGGNKYFGRSNSFAAVGPVLRVDSTVNHTGGTAGSVISTLRVNTTTSSTAVETCFGISSVVNDSRGVGNAMALAAYTIRNTARPNNLSYGLNTYVTDTTGLASSVAGSGCGIEADIIANGLDDGGLAGPFGVPAGAGVRTVLQAVGDAYDDGLADCEIGWGVRVNPSQNKSNVVFKRMYSCIGRFNKAAFSTEFAVPDNANAHAILLASGHRIAFDTAGTRTVSYDSTSGKLFFAVSGVNKFSIDASGNMRCAGTVTGSVTP